MIDITPMPPKHSKLIESYGNEGFIISGEKFSSNIIIAPQIVKNWAISSFNNIEVSDLEWVIEHNPEIIIFGTGENLLQLPPNLKQLLIRHKIPYEVMPTRASVRTYNILVYEARNVVGFIIKL